MHAMRLALLTFTAFVLMPGLANYASASGYEYAALQSNHNDLQKIKKVPRLHDHAVNMLEIVDRATLTATERLKNCADYAEGMLSMYRDLPLSIQWKLTQIKERAARLK